jgi:surface antigen
LTNKIGTTVGAGECWDAAENAIKDIGAARPGSDLYVWGSVVQQADLQPGDILQFSQFTVTVTQDDGSFEQNTFGAPRHTAIVESVNSDGSVNILQQNYGGARNVQRMSNVFLSSGSAGSATVTTSGTVTRYRPQVP